MSTLKKRNTERRKRPMQLRMMIPTLHDLKRAALVNARLRQKERVSRYLGSSVTRLGDLLDFVQH